MARKHQFIIVSQTHWDREWHSTFQQFRMRLVRLTDKLLRILDADPRYRSFTFDGQTIVMEDYLAIRPENRERIIDYVKSGRLMLGPWYVLADEFLVSGEALIRNLMVGHKIGAEFGHVMKAGYVPDAFGHVAQLPQILAGFGLDSALFMRGMGRRGEGLKAEFWWEAPDGTRVLGVHLFTSYANFAHWGFERQPDRRYTYNLETAVPFALRQIEAHAPKASTRYLLGNNGFDHLEPTAELPDLIECANAHIEDTEFVHGTYEDFVRGVLAEQPDLASLRGELREDPVLLSVLSARMYIKQANERTQTLLERWAEPASALAWLWGQPYETSFLWEAWKLCLQNHPHDSICGCSVDQVHREMMSRFEQAQQIGEQLTRNCLSAIAGGIDTNLAPAREDARAMIVFNPLGWSWSGVVRAKMELPHQPGQLLGSFVVRDDAGNEVPCQICNDRIEEHRDIAPAGMDVRELELCFLSDRLPALGYRTYLAEPGAPAHLETDLIVSHLSLENSHLAVTINPNGTVDILDKNNGVVYCGCNLFESTEDIGDEYDYSYSHSSETFTTAGAAARIALVENGPVCATFRIELDFALPARIQADRVRRSDERVSCPITSYVTLCARSRRVDFRTIVDNRAKDHRLRVLFHTGLDAEQSAAEQAFCSVDRPLVTGRSPEASQPLAIQPQQSWVDAHDAERGLTVINQGLPEYEMRPDAEGATVCLTLLRCVSWLSRADFPTRPGRVGPDLPTPEAQCQGVYEFRYAALPHEGTWATAKVWMDAHSHNAPPRAVLVNQHAGDKPTEFSFLRIDNPDIALSAVKKSEREEALVVRVYNAIGDPVKGKLLLGQGVRGWRPVNLNEEPLEGKERLRPASQGAINLSLRAYEIMTLEIHP